MLSSAKHSLSKNSLFVVKEDKQLSAGSPSGSDPTVSEVVDGSFKHWLEREVPIANISWSDGSTFSQTYAILANMLLDTTILSSRMKNYSNFRFDAISIRVVINATPFRAGILMGSWTPLTRSPDVTATYGTTTLGECPYFSGGVSEIEQGATVPGCARTDFNYVMSRSLRAPVFANVSQSQGFEYVIPWRHYRDSLVIDNSWPTTGDQFAFCDQFYNFGYFTLESLGIPLTAGNATTTPVNVLIYAKFINPRVWGPTYTAQSGIYQDPAVLYAGPSHPVEAPHDSTPPMHVPPEDDERVNNMKPSEIASAVADAAGALSAVPVIGFWATATSIVARGASAILGLFGWSNPPIISGRLGHSLYSNVHTVNPCVSAQDDVFALDSRNETTVDPRLTGGPGEDELMIDTWCARPVVLDTVKFNVADTPGQILLSIPVSPNHCRLTFVDNTVAKSKPCVRSSMTPYTYAAQLFDLWRGRFHLRLIPVVSSFHKGSVKIWWDPMGFGSGSLDSQVGLQKTLIHEIAKGPIDFVVDFAAANGFLSVDPSPITVATSSAVNAIKLWGNREAAVTTVQDNLTRYFNGVINVEVLNRLQGESDIYIVVQTWFEDMNFAVPRSDVGSTLGTVAGLGMTNFVTQSGIVTKSDPKYLALLYSGEHVPSLRTLLHRSSIWKLFYHWHSANTNFTNYCYTFPRFPLGRLVVFRNYNSESTLRYFQDGTCGTYGTQGQMVTNWCNTTPLTYLTRCFIGHRGSIVWKALPIDKNAGENGAMFSLSRADVGRALWGKQAVTPATAGNDGMLKIQEFLGSGAAGIMSSTSYSRVLSGVFPSYSKYRMLSADSNHCMDSTVVSGAGFDPAMGRYEGVRFSSTGVSSNEKAALLCCAAGPDFTPLCFLSIPDVYVGALTVPS